MNDLRFRKDFLTNIYKSNNNIKCYLKDSKLKQTNLASLFMYLAILPNGNDGKT